MAAPTKKAGEKGGGGGASLDCCDRQTRRAEVEAFTKQVACPEGVVTSLLVETLSKVTQGSAIDRILHDDVVVNVNVAGSARDARG